MINPPSSPRRSFCRLGASLILFTTFLAGCTGGSVAKCAKEVRVLVSTPIDGYSPHDCAMMRAEAILHIEVLADGSAGKIRAEISKIDPGAQGSCKNPQASIDAMAHHVFGSARFVAPGKRCEKLIAFNVDS